MALGGPEEDWSSASAIVDPAGTGSGWWVLQDPEGNEFCVT
jgi:hypothetical protein